MSRHGLAAFAVSLLVALSSSASAGIVDQSQTTDGVYMAGFAQTDLAQSFMPSLPLTDGAAVKLRAGIGSSPGDITIELWDLLPNVAGASLLATGTDLGVLPGGWAVVDYGGGIPVVPETTYYLVFTSTNLNLGLSGDTSDPYSRGMVHANAGYNPFTGFDYTFETFGVPEPSSFLLLGGGGLLFLALRGRRKRRVGA